MLTPAVKSVPFWFTQLWSLFQFPCVLPLRGDYLPSPGVWSSSPVCVYTPHLLFSPATSALCFKVSLVIPHIFKYKAVFLIL